MRSKSGILPIFCSIAGALVAKAYDNSRYDNVVVYWGQNSYGATHTDKQNFQKPLSFYCEDDAIDVFPVAFVDVFFGPGGVPSMNLANTCNLSDNSTFPGTSLPKCDGLNEGIKTCQSKGKLVTLSLGGATGAVGFSSDDQATAFAKQIWDMFLGGSSDMRPFGDAILDGIDLDIEGGTSAHYAAFVNAIRALEKGASKKYYVTAAPQCVFPDAALGEVLNNAIFDAVYVQFYNNPCGLTHFSDAANWNFGLWDGWARTTSPNKDVKIFIGAPASNTAAGSGYVDPDTLKTIAVQMRKSFPSFGGVMLWDASQAYANDRYDLAIKNTLVAAGGTGFTYPICAAPAWTAGTAYQAGNKVSYGGYLWQAKWYASSQPTNIPNGEWSAISACSGGDTPGDTTTSPTTTQTTIPTTTPTTTKTTTTTKPTSEPSPTSCAGVPAWSETAIYTANSQVAYNSHLWTAQWWTQGDKPGDGQWGPWTDNGPCDEQTSLTTTTVTTTSKTPAPTAGTCSGVTDWSESATYTQGMKVVYKQHLWTAQWWTQGDTPGVEQWGPWKDEGACSTVMGNLEDPERFLRIQPVGR